MIYSPYSQDRCRIRSIEKCEFAIYAEHPFGKAIWNMFWLSNPSVDTLVEFDHETWFLNYDVIDGLGQAITGDVLGDVVLLRHLHLPPLQFLSWWNKQDHSIYDTFDVVGETWPSTVQARAFDSAKVQHVSRLALSRFGVRHLGVTLPFNHAP